MTVIVGEIDDRGFDAEIEFESFYTGEAGAVHRDGGKLSVAFRGTYRAAMVGKPIQVNGLPFVVDKAEESMAPGMVRLELKPA